MSTNYVGNPTAVQSPSVAPAPKTAPTVVIPADTDPNNVATMFTQQYKVFADYLAYLSNLVSLSFFGDGSDGTCTFDGSATVLGLGPSAGAYTLNRDIYCNELTVTGASTVLNTNGFRIFCRDQLVTSGGAKIKAEGAAGSGVTGGSAPSQNSIGGGGTGGASAINASGSAGATVFYSIGGGAGVAGAGGFGSVGAGGAAGVITSADTASRNQSGLHTFNPMLFGYVVGAGFSGGVSGSFGSGLGAITPISGGPGGGGGGGSNTVAGGPGGGGGGVLAISAYNITLANASDLSCKGGNGGAGGVNTGGGGGGGGGVLLLAYQKLTVSAGTLNIVTCCTNGIGGALGSGTSLGGASGTSGSIFQYVLP